MKRQKLLTPSSIVILYFLITILIGTILLSLPFSSATGKTHSLINALFTSTSAVCVTGLTVLDLSKDWSSFGKLVIIILIQVGGLSLMTFTTLFAFLIGKRIAVDSYLVFSDYRALMNAYFEYYQFRGIGFLVLLILSITLIFELVGAILLTLCFAGELGFKKSLIYAGFHSVSAFCNAGFSLFPDNMIKFRGDLCVNAIMEFLIIWGGLGFIVIWDLGRFFYYKIKHNPFNLSLQTKIVLSCTLLLIIIPSILFLLLENSHLYKDFSFKEKMLCSVFQSITARTAGFNTISQNELTPASSLLTAILMFIGASPGSTGGGIKTTTFVILFLFIASFIQRKDRIEVFKSSIPDNLVKKAIAITFLFFFSIAILIFLLTIIEYNNLALRNSINQNDFSLSIIFEVVSAFGTVGLSKGITPFLSTSGKLLITMAMFIGRVGILTIAFLIHFSHLTPQLRYAESDVMVA